MSMFACLGRFSFLSLVHRGHSIVGHWLHLLTHSGILDRLVSEVVEFRSPPPLQLEDLYLSDGWGVQLIHHLNSYSIDDIAEDKGGA